ncbi:MAG: DUF2796 domain-containing protein [Bryobacteraceae bacterium]|nr:DUF2796 domain-containing protein [Bryobacteraceae bacterium]
MRILTIVFCFALAAFADEKGKKHSHDKKGHGHSHGAHTHDTAEINIAVDGVKGDIELHVPGMGVVGFEHIATTAADKKKQADALSGLKGKIGQIVVFDAAAGCKITPKSVEVEQEEEDHSHVDADFAVSCAKPLGGTKVTFGMTKAYPSITTVKVQVIGATGSTGAEIKNDKGSVTLSK